MPRLTKIYTRNGDEGYTSIRDNTISKDDLLLQVVGDVDELNSAVGMIIALPPICETTLPSLTQVQQDLFDFGGDMHVPQRCSITPEKTAWLESQIDAWNSELPSLQEFILPRGNPASAACHMARAICRRTERSLVKLNRQVTLENPEMLRYLNRLSDFLFVASRMLARESNEKELMWENVK